MNILPGNKQLAIALAVAPDGTRLYSAHSNHLNPAQVVEWNLASGHVTREIDSGLVGRPLSSLAVTASHLLICTGSNSPAFVVPLLGGEGDAPHRLGGDAGPICWRGTLAISPDGL